MHGRRFHHAPVGAAVARATTLVGGDEELGVSTLAAGSGIEIIALPGACQERALSWGWQAATQTKP